MKQAKTTQKEYGRRGGLIGGKIRAERLSDERKREIARKAAEARWSKAERQVIKTERQIIKVES
jgi:hypothetical protein